MARQHLPKGMYRISKPDEPPVWYEAATYTSPVEYPTAWFNRNPNTKPPCVIYLSNLSVAQLTMLCHQNLESGKVSLELALAFMAKFASKSLTMTLVQDWTSLGILIGKKNTVVSPLSLLEVNEQHLARAENIEELDDQLIKGVMLHILMINRVQQGTINPAYQTIIENMFREQFAQHHCTIQVAAMRLHYTSWWSDRNYNTQCSAIDMFLFKVKGDLSYLRLGTIHLRDKDCGLKVALDTFMKVRKVPYDKLAYSICTVELAAELSAVTSTEEGMGDPFSYAHYVMAMRLTEKSPCSTSVSPNLHLWLHTIGVLLGDERSRNARLVPGANTEYTIHNGILIARMLQATVALKQIYRKMENGVPIDDEVIPEPPYDDYGDDQQNDRDNCPAEPKNPDPLEWIQWVYNCPSAPKLPKYVLKEAYEVLAALPPCQERSIGQYLKDRGESYLLELKR